MVSSRSALNLGAVFLAQLYLSAQAQEQPGEAVAVAGTRVAEEEIVVTGSRIRRKDLTTPAPVTVIGRDQLATSSRASIGDFLQQLPEHGASLSTQVNNGGDGETRINLRNIGSNRTLVLVDGKRFVNGGIGAGAAVDLNSIPTAAVERIEILKDGGSAVYGSDAIAGVVNIITRKKFDGVSATAYTGLSGHNDANVYDVNLLGGSTGPRGSFMVGAGFYDQSHFFAGARTWAKETLGWDFNRRIEIPAGSPTTPKARVNGFDPTNPLCTTALCAGLRSAFPNAGPTHRLNLILDNDHAVPGVPYVHDPLFGGDWRELNQTADFYNYQSVNYLVTPQQRKSIFGNGSYNLSDFARAYFQISYVQRQSKLLVAPEPFATQFSGVKVSRFNEYNPFGVDLPSVQRRLTDLSGRGFADDVNTYQIMTGFDGTLGDFAGPLSGWYWDVGINYGRGAGTDQSSGFLNTQRTAPGLGPSRGGTCYTDGSFSTSINNCTPVNLLGPPGTITPDMASQLGAYVGTGAGITQLFIVNASAGGELVRLLADRPISLAFGYEWRSELGAFQNNPILTAGWDSDTGAPGPLDTRGSFYVNEGYAELVAPLVSGLPWAEQVEVQGAARAFKYNTFGSDLTYKFGGRYSPVRDFTVRGTYSTAFRAPNILELFRGQSGGGFAAANDPCSDRTIDDALNDRCNTAPVKGGGPGSGRNGQGVDQINTVSGGNPALKPETAQIATVGAVFEPRVAKGLTLTADFYWILLKQTIGALGTQTILNRCFGAGGLSQDASFCKLVERQPETKQVQRVTDIAQNVGQLTTRGIDFGAQYHVPWTDYGRFLLRFSGNWLLSYDYRDPSGRLIRGAGNYDGFGSVTATGAGNFNPRFKFNTGVTYGIGGFAANVAAYYWSPLTECAPQGGIRQTGSAGFCYQKNADPATGIPYAIHRVSESWRWDASVSYNLKWPIGDSTLQVGVRNAFDQRPPRIYNSFLTYADPSYDLIGRFWYSRLEHRF